MERDPALRLRKRELRRIVVASILRLQPAIRREQEGFLSRSFINLPGLTKARTVLLYVNAFPEELDARPYLLHCLERGMRVVLPRVDRPSRCLRLAHVRSLEADLEAGSLGIPEPRKECPSVEPGDIDWALVPGIAFDPRCYRLGRGAGYYDRLLPLLRADTPRWALGFDVQLLDELPVEPHDVPVDGVMTPNRLVRRAEAF